MATNDDSPMNDEDQLKDFDTCLKNIDTNLEDIDRDFNSLVTELHAEKSKNDSIKTENLKLIATCKNKDAEIDKLKEVVAAFKKQQAILNGKIYSMSVLRCKRTFNEEKICPMQYITLSFKVNEDVALVGLQLPTQVLENAENQMYSEIVQIIVKFECEPVSRECVRYRQVPFNSQWDILLDTPINILRNQEYDVRVCFAYHGRYPLAITPPRSTDTVDQFVVTWLRKGEEGGLVRALLLEEFPV